MFGFVNHCPFPHSLSARRSLTTTTVVGPANRLTALTHFEYRGRKGGRTDRPRTLAMRVKGSFISRFALYCVTPKGTQSASVFATPSRQRLHMTAWQPWNS